MMKTSEILGTTTSWGRTMRALSLLALLALTACREAVVPVLIPDPTLTVSRARGSGRAEWPRGSGDTIRVNNSLDDEAGLAGLEVEITDVADGIARTMRFDASDIKEGVARYDVPESGSAHAMLRLTQHGRVVATGVAEWPLRPAIQWEVEIERSHHPFSAVLPDGIDVNQTKLPCVYWWCQNVWRFDISEDATNFPGETLWMALWAVDPTSCQDLCFDGG